MYSPKFDFKLIHWPAMLISLVILKIMSKGLDPKISTQFNDFFLVSSLTRLFLFIINYLTCGLIIRFNVDNY